MKGRLLILTEDHDDNVMAQAEYKIIDNLHTVGFTTLFMEIYEDISPEMFVKQYSPAVDQFIEEYTNMIFEHQRTIGVPITREKAHCISMGMLYELHCNRNYFHT